VTDFGLACDVKVENYKNYMVGTPGYYSPEHISESAIDQRTDIYCAGLILFELMTGQKAVKASNDRQETLARMKEIPFKLIQFKDWWFNWKLKRVLKKALAFNRMRRTKNCEQMMFDIYKILRQNNIHYTRLAIHQYLADVGLTPKHFNGQKQNIYKHSK
jgi:serine/threonine protein kinase